MKHREGREGFFLGFVFWGFGVFFLKEQVEKDLKQVGKDIWTTCKIRDLLDLW